jgi:hypothetical protein
MGMPVRSSELAVLKVLLSSAKIFEDAEISFSFNSAHLFLFNMYVGLVFTCSAFSSGFSSLSKPRNIGAHIIGLLKIESFNLSIFERHKQKIEYQKTVAQVILILIKDLE